MRGRAPVAALCATLVVVVSASALAGQQPRPLHVGSKKFTESVVLGEVLTQLAREAGRDDAVHLRELGGTRVLFDALRSGEVDAYVEYSGTLRNELLPEAREASPAALEEALGRLGLRASAPLGFQNTYAIGLREEVAARLGISTLSDLARHPEVRLGFSAEFMDRADGWPGLSRRYALPHAGVRGMDHDLAYRALQSGDLDGTDLYTTDAEIRAYGLRVLVDDLQYFPRYEAFILYRAALAGSAPEALEAWGRLAGRIDEPTMIAMNARAKLEGVPEAIVASDFLGEALGIRAGTQVESRAQRIGRTTVDHLGLVAASLSAAILVGVPLGLIAARRRRAGRLILGVVGVVQTIPSLALLVFMIPLLGIGSAPAIAALFLYGLLPIVRGTHAGLTSIPAELRDSARALGLPPATNLLRIEVPLASRAIFSGIKTSAVINVGTATLGALIGAGGYGQPILTGIRLAQTSLILEGAIPAAVLALLVQGAFDLLERIVVPRGLRLERGR